MANVSLTVTDLDLEAGTYKVDFLAEGSEIDDGQATAAYFTAFYLNTIINTPDFLAGVCEFGRELVNGLTRDDPNRPMTKKTAAMKLRLIDKDVETGRFYTTLENSGGDPTGESLPTTAQVVGAYMRFLITDMTFRERVWAFAEEFVANHEGASIPNTEHAPATKAA